ncbi:MAG: pyridoxal-phosphate dependent enzyme [Pseudomonadota bacterium]
MQIYANPHRGNASAIAVPSDTPYPSDDLQRPVALISTWPEAGVTALQSVPGLAPVAHLDVKDERTRMGLGSFKALGAAYVIGCDAAAGRAAGQTYVTASAGNHGLSVAFGAQSFGAKAVIYISNTVPEGFAERLRARGAEVRREGDIYEDSMAAAARAAEDNNWQLLSDSSWEGYYERPHRLMEGYLTLMSEVFDQIEEMPSHIFLQAGVGGLATACAVAARAEWGDGPTIIVVEPEAAPALLASVQAGKSVIASGPVSCMGRLDCKEPSLIALKGLARDADWFCTISEEDAQDAMATLAQAGLATTPSGGAGVVALMRADGRFGLSETSRVLCILSEAPE